MLDQKFNEWLEENPALKSVLPYMPDVKRNFFENLVSQEIVNRFVEENKVTEKPEYKKDEKLGAASIKQALNYKYFMLANPVTVADADVKAFYEEHKDQIPELLVSRGGVNATGVAFDREDAAKAFMAKAQKGDFTKVAKEAGMADKVRDFKFVNAKSVGIDPALRNKIVATTKFPAVELVAAGNQFWVVSASNKEEAKYRPFEDVKPDLEREVEKQRRMKALEEKIGQLKVTYGVTVNENYFKSQTPGAQQGPDMMQAQAAQPGVQEEAPALQPAAAQVA
jgi:hypothetical protein